MHVNIYTYCLLKTIKVIYKEKKRTIVFSFESRNYLYGLEFKWIKIKTFYFQKTNK
jgi:hypothetical protein